MTNGAGVDQKMESLAYANRVRTARAAVKRRIREGEFSPLDVLQEPTDLIAGMSVRDLLMSVRKLGPVKIDRALALCRISPNKPIGNLTERQVWDIDEHLSSQNAWVFAIRPR